MQIFIRLLLVIFSLVFSSLSWALRANHRGFGLA
jgi:hypothetical protein